MGKKFQEDTSAHRRNRNRRIISRIGILLLVLSGLLVALGLLISASSLAFNEVNRDRILRFGVGYVASGAGLWLIWLLFFILPERFRAHRSPSQKRRRRQLNMPPAGKPAEEPTLPSGFSPKQREGSVLPAVLVILAIVSAILVQVRASTSVHADREEASVHRFRARTAAMECARELLQRIADDPDTGIDRSDDPWTEVVEWTDPDGVNVIGRAIDLNRYYDLNNVAVPSTGATRPASDILHALLNQSGQFSTETPVSALRDWMDGDKEGMYEQENLARRNKPVLPPNRAVFTWNELLLVDGWTRAMFDRSIESSAERGLFDAPLDQCVTIIPVPRSRAIPVNINTAPRPVLLGLFGLVREDIVDRIVTFRELREIRSLDMLPVTPDEWTASGVMPYLDVKSSFFLVEAQSWTGEAAGHVRWIAARSDNGTMSIIQSIL